ncbi:MAG TPA: ribonuclease P protein component [Polyangiaceae bacterium]
MPGAFPARERVRKRSEYLHVQANARRVVTPHFVLLLAVPVAGRAGSVPSQPPCARLGVTVSRRVGNAVIRNRAKRLVREAFRATRDLWRPDLDVVVIVRQALTDLTCLDVVQEWRRAARAIEQRSRDACRTRPGE